MPTIIASLKHLNVEDACAMAQKRAPEHERKKINFVELAVC
jgi:hypothetical protein